MTNRLWPTDRVRICIKEYCRMHNLPYSSVSREEGLAVLASIANYSISEIETLNPIHFVRLFLNDTRDDPIELIIKLCHLFGPYTYKGLAALYSQEYRLPPILEEPTLTDGQKLTTDSDQVMTDTVLTDISDQVMTDISDQVMTDTVLTEPVMTDISDQIMTDISDQIMTEPVMTETVNIQVSNNPSLDVSGGITPFLVPKSTGCGCFWWV